MPDTAIPRVGIFPTHWDVLSSIYLISTHYAFAALGRPDRFRGSRLLYLPREFRRQRARCEPLGCRNWPNRWVGGDGCCPLSRPWFLSEGPGLRLMRVVRSRLPGFCLLGPGARGPCPLPPLQAQGAFCSRNGRGTKAVVRVSVRRRSAAGVVPELTVSAPDCAMHEAESSKVGKVSARCGELARHSECHLVRSIGWGRPPACPATAGGARCREGRHCSTSCAKY